MADKLRKSESTIRSRVDCEEKAFHIVNRLIDGKVDGQYFIKCGHYLSREHYADVVEERAISYLCGYPLCDNRLKDIPKKQFHISTVSNKVYDISERKNFCSNQCLKASKHYTSQIPESPLWSRAKVAAVEIKLLPHTGIRGIVGSEVIGISPQKLLEIEIKKLEELDIRSAPSRKTLEQINSKSPASKKTTTSSSNNNGNKIKSFSGRSENADSDVGQSKDVGDGTRQCSFDENEEDCTTSKLEETIDREAALEVSDDNCPSGTDVVYKGKEETPFQQKVDLVEKQKDDSIKNGNYVSTVANKETVCDAEFIDEFSQPILHKNLQTVSESEKSTEETSKMDYLMKLLSKRKGNLSGMVDVVTAISDTAQVTLPENKDTKVDTVSSSDDAGKYKLGDHTPEQSSPQANFIQPSFSQNSSQANFIQPSVSQNSPQTSIIHPSNQNSSRPRFTNPSANQKSLEASTAKNASRNKKQSSEKPKPIIRSPLNHIGAILKTWITEDTTAYILSSSASGGADDGPMTFSDPRIQRGYEEMCQRLDAQQEDFDDLLNETGGSDLNTSDTGMTLKSVPDYKALMAEAAALQLKVTELSAGKSLEPVEKKKDYGDGENDEILIPTVDAYDQRQIRVKIVLERLEKFLPDVLSPLHLPLQAVSSHVRELVYTFRLEKDNIVFRPSEWILVSIFLLKMLGKKSRNISAAFTEETAIRYFTVLLKGIGHTLTDLDTVMDNILSS